MSEEPILVARDLARHYTVRRGAFRSPATVKALNGVSFKLYRGRTLAVVGESGCGKSTLARLVTTIEKPTSGHLEIEGHDIATASRREIAGLREEVQIVFQDPYGSLNPRRKVGDILGEPLAINRAMSRAERRDAARAMIEKVGLRPEHIDRYPHMFSGGQRQRIAVGRALMLNPKIVVADEPVSALDMTIQKQVLTLFRTLQRRYGFACLFISHDLAAVEEVADRVAVMQAGRIVETGTVAQIFDAPREPYTRALLAASPTVDLTRILESAA